MRLSPISITIIGALSVAGFFSLPSIIHKIRYAPETPFNAQELAKMSVDDIISSPTVSRCDGGNVDGVCFMPLAEVHFRGGKIDHAITNPVDGPATKYLTPELIDLPCDETPNNLSFKDPIGSLVSALNDGLIWKEGCGGPMVVARTTGAVISANFNGNKSKQDTRRGVLVVYFNEDTFPRN